MSKSSDSPDGLLTNIYKDILSPTMQEYGKALALLPRAVNAALQPIDLYLHTKEVNHEEIKKLVIEKASKKSPDDIVPPDPYVAVPAMQALSYSIDSDALRNAYANLLSASIDKNMKDYVHPSFVEALKQLSPIDVKVFDSVLKHKLCVIVDLVSYASYDGIYPKSQYILETNISGLEISNHLMQGAAFNLLSRLGFIEIQNTAITDDSCYAPIYASNEYRDLLQKHSERPNLAPIRKHFIITDLGELFGQVCFDS